MRRRTLLTVGLAGGTLLAVAGVALSLRGPVRPEGRLDDAGRALFAALAAAMLQPLMPADPTARAQALRAHLGRVEAAIEGLPPALQAEVDELLLIATRAPGRIAFIGLPTPWGQATVDEVTAALEGLRQSSLALRQQAFHALRDLTHASWFSDDSSWAAIGYPGPLEVQT